MNIVDVMFHVHQDLSEEQRNKIEETISANNGVMHVNFNDGQSHELTITYDPDAIRADYLLNQLREWDSDVKMVGL